jgi:hypothetical protein
MVDNMWLHSETAQPGLLAYQVHRRRFAFSVVETGIGILASLKKNSIYEDLSSSMDAIRYAIQPGVTRLDSGGLGFSNLIGALQTCGAMPEYGAVKQPEVELLGLDVFDPVEMVNRKSKGNDVPAWFLDTDYNNLCFHVSQAFFPRTGAWENLKKALRADYEESVWHHLAGAVSAPFEAGEHKQVAVKVIDARGNELMVVQRLGEAR